MFLDKCLGFRLELVDEFTKIVPNALFMQAASDDGL